MSNNNKKLTQPINKEQQKVLRFNSTRDDLSFEERINKVNNDHEYDCEDESIEIIVELLSEENK